jgi:hypothetical protein
MTVVVKYRDTHETTWTTNLNISTATSLRLIAKNIKTKAVTTLAVALASDFSVTHVLTGTLPIGDYDVELEASFGGTIITSPSHSYERLRVLRDVA